MVPLTMLRQKAFREFVEALDPRYVLPGIPSISKIHIPNFDKKIMEEVRMDLKNPEVKHVAMTSDGWSSKVSVHIFTFINSEVQNQKFSIFNHLKIFSDNRFLH